jgi:hypothetical protein
MAFVEIYVTHPTKFQFATSYSCLKLQGCALFLATNGRKRR